MFQTLEKNISKPNNDIKYEILYEKIFSKDCIHEIYILSSNLCSEK